LINPRSEVLKGRLLNGRGFSRANKPPTATHAPTRRGTGLRPKTALLHPRSCNPISSQNGLPKPYPCPRKCANLPGCMLAAVITDEKHSTSRRLLTSHAAVTYREKIGECVTDRTVCSRASAESAARFHKVFHSCKRFLPAKRIPRSPAILRSHGRPPPATRSESNSSGKPASPCRSARCAVWR